MILGLMIVIVNLNLKDDTLALIQSLLQAGAVPEHIILVDNGSSDGSVAAVQEQFGNQVHIIANQQNNGFAGGSNQGFDLAVELGAAWILLLNNDTLVAPDFFEQIEKVLSSDTTYQILSPAIFYYSAPEIIWHLGSDGIPGTLLARNRFQGKKLPVGFPPLLPQDFISGCAMLIRQDVYLKVGLFDTRFFAYWEEVDFCIRARQAGFLIASMPQVKMWHKVSSTANRDKVGSRYLYTRNMIFYTRKNARAFQWPIMITYLFARLIITFIKDIIFRRTYLIRPLFKGWKDGWLQPGFVRDSANSRQQRAY
jgi:GT2 family glycosyltransferase